MPLDVTLIVSLLGPDAERRSEFTRAMCRRGWWVQDESRDSYRVSMHNADSDDDVVQLCERDVKESAYVAGVSKYQATCLIAADQPSHDNAGCDADWTDHDGSAE